LLLPLLKPLAPLDKPSALPLAARPVVIRPALSPPVRPCRAAAGLPVGCPKRQRTLARVNAAPPGQQHACTPLRHVCGSTCLLLTSWLLPTNRSWLAHRPVPLSIPRLTGEGHAPLPQPPQVATPQTRCACAAPLPLERGALHAGCASKDNRHRAYGPCLCRPAYYPRLHPKRPARRGPPQSPRSRTGETQPDLPALKRAAGRRTAPPVPRDPPPALAAE
jgi:hypothetical protein